MKTDEAKLRESVRWACAHCGRYRGANLRPSAFLPGPFPLRLEYGFSVMKVGRVYVVEGGGKPLGEAKTPAEVYGLVGAWADQLENRHAERGQS